MENCKKCGKPRGNREKGYGESFREGKGLMLAVLLCVVIPPLGILALLIYFLDNKDYDALCKECYIETNQ
ncbi:hypothetical protein [Bacillus cereus]|uniref:hypothetical protein n=1 Tax=Bacillus cereus TaxID=1396 RepID=UPI000A301A17|nr:hypothetical protein [Bacillus cereus]PWN68815.1 hypothetical protein CV741_28285 [Bacillus cereus]PWN77336.1 hypothetical protein CV717_28310 [Bacillus cereus]SMD60734.1 hypothetical protein BACERE00195_00014 [Bacillus cereus]